MEDSLQGKLLIAAPALSDYFRRSVVLVIEHDDDGAMGLVLNRPTESEVIEAVPSLSPLVDGGELIHAGGPVQPDSVLVLGDFEEPESAGTTVTGTLGLLDPEVADPALRRVRVFAGYAGWAPGQLDREIEEEAWFTVDVDPGDPFDDDSDLWAAALLRKGGEHALLAWMPADPTMN